MSSASVTPSLPLAAPRACVSLADQHFADIAPRRPHDHKGAAETVDAAAAQLQTAGRKQFGKAQLRSLRGDTFAATAAFDLRSIDALDAKLLARKPERVTVDNTADPFSLAAKRQRGNRAGLRNDCERKDQCRSEHPHRFSSQSRSIHLGTFEGEALRRAGLSAAHHDGTVLRDLASAFAALALWSSVAFLLFATFAPELPA